MAYKYCDGAPVPRGTFRYHNDPTRIRAPTAKWLAAHPEALKTQLTDNAPQPSGSGPPLGATGPELRHHMPPSELASSTSAPDIQLISPFRSPENEPRTPTSKRAPLPEEPLTPRQRRLPIHDCYLELASRDAAEIVGEDYMRSVLASPPAFDPVDIGTVDGEYGGEQDEEDESEAEDGHTGGGVEGAPAEDARGGSSNSGSTSHHEPPAGCRHEHLVADDIFRSEAGTEDALETVPFNDCHPALLLLYVLVVWLHTQFKVPFRACSAILSIFYHIMLLARVDPVITDGGWTTLPTILKRLGVEPSFRVLPLCPSCKAPHPPTQDSNATCHRCSEPLFYSVPRTSRRTASGGINSETTRPRLQMPLKSIEAQLRDILAIPGIEEELEKWRGTSRQPDLYQDNFDGRICRTLPAADGRPFFENPLPYDVASELRIGLTLGVDWFSYLRSQITASHSSAPLSFNIINLPPHMRYRTANLLLCALLPGPKEQTGDEIQPIMRIFVDELLRLWAQGFWIFTAAYPFGRLVRAILVCVICDKPAAHKLGGFGSHSAHFFCTKCWITQRDKATSAAFEHEGFRERTHAEQVDLGKRYAGLTTEAARKQFVHEHASRYCELSRLPYFDVCRMIVIDPMHNLLLGLAKTHFYHIWIQLKVLRKRRELLCLHAILAKFKIPSYMGRLPALMGEPAGGSLTADQWLLATTVVAPIAVPQIWDEYCVVDGPSAEVVRQRRIATIAKNIEEKKAAEQAVREAKKAAKARAAAAAAAARAAEVNERPKRKRKKTAKAQQVEVIFDDGGPEEHILDAGAIEDETDPFVPDAELLEEDEDEDDSGRAPNLHPDDPSNFLKLATALDLLMARNLRKQDVLAADGMLRAYCKELIHLYGPEVIKPNHHYAMHTLECVLDFGPLHGFWTFLFERINKVLKSYNSANHSGGELETSFFREFHRSVQQARVVAKLRKHPNRLFANSFDIMSAATADDRGTVQALARELDELPNADSASFVLSSRGSDVYLQGRLYILALQHVQSILPFRVRDWTDRTYDARPPLMPHAFEHDWATVRGRRYWASSRAKKIDNSLVLAFSDGQVRLGELTHVYSLPQPHLGVGGVLQFGHVRWFVRAAVEISESAWASSSRLGVAFWELDVFEGNDGMGSLVALPALVGMVARDIAFVRGRRCWVTKVLRQE